MPGPLPKSEGRQRRNKPTALKVLPGGLVGRKVPDAPKGLLRATQKEWVQYWTSDLAQLTEPDTDIMAIERLFTCYDEHRRALTAAKKSRLVLGSTGQLVLNPLLKYVESLAGEIRALEDRFGLTPKARLTLGIAFGEATRTLEDLNRSVSEDDSVGDLGDDPRIQASR